MTLNEWDNGGDVIFFFIFFISFLNLHLLLVQGRKL